MLEVRISGYLHREILEDLARPHPFAAERAGFSSARMGSLADGGRLVLLNGYHSIPDDQYLEGRSVGARIGPEALRWAMQAVYHGRPAREGIFHVHVHDHAGQPRLGRVDRCEIPRLMPGFQSVGTKAPHGIVLLSRDDGVAWVWLPGSREAVAADKISVIAKPVGVFERGAGR